MARAAPTPAFANGALTSVCQNLRMADPAPSSSAENRRLELLSQYSIMDTEPEEEFDRLARLSTQLFHVPIALVSIVGRDRQFFKARVGLDVCATSREVSFCSHAIEQDGILVIPDAIHDERFASNPLVLGPPFIRFYAGKPLVTPGGEKLGTICLIDTEPRTGFSAEDQRNLSDIAALVMDRLEMRRLDHLQLDSRARFENIAATSADAIICTNAEGEVTFWNRSAEALYGYTAEEVLDRSIERIVPDSWRAIFDEEIERLRRGEHLELADHAVELSGLRKDGSEFPIEFTLSTWLEGNATNLGVIVRDITERRQNEERLFRLASLDALTGLPNRGAWQDELNGTLAAGQPASTLLLDLDGFKEINDTLGHNAGDHVLKQVAHRIQSVCDKALMVARLGGDEFVALLPGDDVRAAETMARQLVSTIAEPVEFGGETIEVRASIGIAVAPQHGRSAEEFFGAADLALYRAKAAGKARFEVFTAALREVAVARRAFEIELREAFERGEFELFYQPQVAVPTGELTGAEALMRWNHPVRGLLTPASFMDVLSAKSSAPAVGEWVLRTACRQAAEWRKRVPGFRIGVNLFEAQFRSGKLLSVVQGALDDSGLSPHALELEIVENILLRPDGATLRLLQDLRQVGVELAFDDYGTGFASLSLLKRYPVSRLKIDRSFIRDLAFDQEDVAVVKAILYLGESFGLQVTAEGVETQEQWDFLKENGCPEAQGFLFGKPVSATSFSNWIDRPRR